MKKPDDLNLQLPDETRREAEQRKPDALGAELIYAERVRQINEEQHTLTRDRHENRKGELAQAGASYAILAAAQSDTLCGADVRPIAPPRHWPWPGAWWKPSNSRLHNLVRAGALVAAEIDRLLAEGEKMPEPEAKPAAQENEPEQQPEHTAP